MTRKSARPHALVFDDDPISVALLSRRLESVGVIPVGTVSLSQALRHLGATGVRPVAAIVGFEETVTSGARRGSAVLARLFSQHPDCETIVTTPDPASSWVRQAVALAHPGARIHDRGNDHQAAGQWIERIFSRGVGDVRLDQGLVLHQPTLRVHHHVAGVHLVIRYPMAVTFRDETASRAARRFSQWLSDVGSTLTVVAHGEWKYRLAALDR